MKNINACDSSKNRIIDFSYIPSHTNTSSLSNGRNLDNIVVIYGFMKSSTAESIFAPNENPYIKGVIDFINVVGMSISTAEQLVERAGGGIEGLTVSGVKAFKLTNGLGLVGSVFTTGYSSMKIYNAWQKGGWNEVSKRDVLDASVGALGVVATGSALAAEVVGISSIAVFSAPVTLTIGLGIIGYGVGTLVIDSIYDK